MRGYLPWTGGTYLGREVPTSGWGYLPWTGYAAGGTPLAASHREDFLVSFLLSFHQT